ncbi:MAG: Calx-beta domain-containing protein [Panacagrimonas sp.]
MKTTPPASFRNRFPLRPIAAVLATGLFASPAAPVLAATLDVGVGGCTLADAITAANTNNATGSCPAGSGADIIRLPVSGTLPLSAALPALASEIVIEGRGSTVSKVVSSNLFRIFAINPGATVILRDTVMSGGSLGSLSNGDYSSLGGGILNRGTLTLTGCAVSGSNASGGGGIFNGGTLNLDNSVISGNVASFGGGGISSNGVVTITRSTLSGNRVSGTNGGAMQSSGTVTLTDSTVTSNTAGNTGGGIASFGILTVLNSTVSGNTAGSYGGGIFNSGNSASLTVTNSTVSGNRGNSGGGIYNRQGSTRLVRSLISGNTAVFTQEVRNYLGTVTAANSNLFGQSAFSNAGSFFNFAPGGSDRVATSDGATPTTLSAIVSPLGNNGGPTRTHALPAGSPAIDAAGACTGTDQRGIVRPKDGNGSGTAECDIGAFEIGVNSADLAITKTAAQSTAVMGDNLRFTLAVSNNGDPNTGVLVADTLPSGLGFVSATPTQGTCAQSGGTVSCNLNAMASAATASVSVVAATPQTGSFTNTASVIGDLADANPDNNTDSVIVTVAAADTTPDSFSFPPRLRVELLQAQTSESVTITGINRPAVISVSGAADSQFSIGCLPAGFTSTPGTIAEGQTVCVRHPSSGVEQTSTETILTIGGVPAAFTSVTRGSRGTVGLGSDFTARLEGDALGDGFFFVFLTRVGGDFGPASVTVRTVDGTATSGSDYTLLNQVVSWGDGDSSNKSVIVQIINDTDDEPDETVSLVLSGASGAALGAPATATLSIVDNDEPAPTGTVQLSAATDSVIESGPAAILTLTRTGGTAGPASVRLSTANGSASAGSDYTATATTVTWNNADSASKTVSIPIREDLLVESPETFTAALSGATGAGLGSLTSATVTITDNDTATPPDTVPNAFSFQDQRGVRVNQVITSNKVTITGLGAGVNTPIRILSQSGSGASYSINGAAFRTTPATVKNGDKLRLRNRVPQGRANASVSLSVGGVSDVWNLSTSR